jgi:hypothetical protein
MDACRGCLSAFFAQFSRRNPLPADELDQAAVSAPALSTAS